MFFETYFAMCFVDLVVLKNVSKMNGLVNSSRLNGGVDVQRFYSPSNKADEQPRQWQNESNVGEVAHREPKERAFLLDMTLDLVFLSCYLLNGFHLKIAQKLLVGHESGRVQEIALDVSIFQ